MALSVLIIDDSMDNRFLLACDLADEGFECIEAEGGKSGVELARADQPDIILLDYHMPIVDGIETYRLLQEDRKTCDLPVIFLTADDSSSNIEVFFGMGVKDVIGKPYDIGQLVPRIRRAIQDQKILLEVRRLNTEMEYDLQHALDVQESLLPEKTIGDDRIACAWKYCPCSTIGGDGLGFGKIGNKIVAYIYDVSGHGVAAALLSVQIAYCLNELSKHGDDPRWTNNGEVDDPNPRCVVEYLNRTFRFNERTRQFFSLMIFILDPDTGDIELCNAGHPGIMIKEKSGSIRCVESPQPVIGVAAEDYCYKTERVRVEHGDRFYLMTDGINESRNADGAEYTTDQLLNGLSAVMDLDLESEIEMVWSSVLAWRSESYPQDDAALIGFELR